MKDGDSDVSFCIGCSLAVQKGDEGRKVDTILGAVCLLLTRSRRLGFCWTMVGEGGVRDKGSSG